jgi:hypothetical protein
MFSFQYCLDVLGGKPRGDAPKLIFYRKARLQGLFDFLDTVLRLPSRPRYEKVHDITLNPPDGWPIVLIDDVRFVGPNKEALAVIVGTDSCGSLGAKYLGVFVLTGEAISFVGPGPWV